jgi:hypothetical protein
LWGIVVFFVHSSLFFFNAQSVTLARILKPCTPGRLVIIIDSVTPWTAFSDVLIQQIATVKSTAPEVYLPLRVWLLSEIGATGNLVTTHQQQLVVSVDALVLLAFSLTDSLQTLLTLPQP